MEETQIYQITTQPVTLATAKVNPTAFCVSLSIELTRHLRQAAAQKVAVEEVRWLEQGQQGQQGQQGYFVLTGQGPKAPLIVEARR